MKIMTTPNTFASLLVPAGIDTASIGRKHISLSPRALVLWFIFVIGLLSTFALATPTQIELQISRDSLILNADSTIRYYVDYAAKTVIVPDAQLREGQHKELALSFGAQLEQRSDGVILIMPSAFTTSISVDGKHLTISKAIPVAARTTAESTTDGRVPTLIPIENANPAQVAAMLQQLYPNLRVIVDERQRAILVIASAEDRSVIDATIKLLDTPRPQVLFEAEVIEVNRSTAQQLGIDYTKLINLNFRFGEGAVAPGQLNFGVFQRQAISLEFGLQALKNGGAARTLAQPRIVTLDGLEASINATRTRPIKVVQAGNITLVNITTGITMKFLPKIATNQSIESRLNIVVSSPTESVDNVPGYSTREASTTVRVLNGEPIVIGGLLETRTSTSSSGVPLLSDIPYLGELFKTTSTEESMTDLVIVVTPRIIQTSGFATEP
jgi:general secretion pathway protein D